jgi:hypothetical protein
LSASAFLSLKCKITQETINPIQTGLKSSQSTQHRLFIIEQLKPIMRELEALELSALTISEALAHYQNLYQIF